MYPELLVISLVAVVSLGCQQTLSDDFKERVKFSHLVATGEITDSFSDTSFQMTLGCILKDNGAQPSVTINITHTSNSLDGRCFVNNFQKGKSYLVFLRYNRPSFNPQSQEEELSKVADVLQVCGLGVVSTVPKGTSVPSTCQDVQARTCTTTVPPATTPRQKKTPPGFLKTTRPGVDLSEIQTSAIRSATVTSHPDATVDRNNGSPNYNNTATQRHKNTMWYITWCITWYIICLLCRTDV